MADAELMHAVQYSSYGGDHSALKHVEVPLPTPGKREVLVKVEAASVNPLDWRLQSGNIPDVFKPAKFPHIPVTDIAGEVVSLGPEVDTFAIGDKVVSWIHPRMPGGLAQFAVAPLEYTVKRPPEVSAVDGACLPVAAVAALQSVRDAASLELDGSSNANVIVTAAAGGVGVYAVQIAKLSGAHVTATCGARNVELVRSLGADEVLDYKTPEGDALKSPSNRQYDVVIHCTDNIPFSKFSPNLKPGAKVIDLVRSLATTAVTKEHEYIPLVGSASRKDLELLTDLVKSGKLKTVVDSQHPLWKAEEAWARSQEGHATGKVVVTFEA